MDVISNIREGIVNRILYHKDIFGVFGNIFSIVLGLASIIIATIAYGVNKKRPIITLEYKEGSRLISNIGELNLKESYIILKEVYIDKHYLGSAGTDIDMYNGQELRIYKSIKQSIENKSKHEIGDLMKHSKISINSILVNEKKEIFGIYKDHEFIAQAREESYEHYVKHHSIEYHPTDEELETLRSQSMSEDYAKWEADSNKQTFIDHIIAIRLRVIGKSYNEYIYYQR